MKRILQLNNKLSALILLLLLSVGQHGIAQPTVLGTSVAAGTYTTYNLSTVGGFKQVRVLATSSAASGARNWEFATGTAAATIYNPNWRPYTGGNTMSTNTFIPTSFANGAKYNTGGGASGLLPAIVLNSYYTFNVSNLATADNVMSLLETTYNPVTISSTTRYNNTVNIVTSGTPNASENIFVRYTTNAFASSTIVQATGSGTTWAATIPITSGSVTYYIYTSNRTKAAIDGDVTTYGQGVHDMSTLSLNNNAQANYTYTAVNPIAWNVINDANPSAANPYTNGQVVNSNATFTGIARAAALTAASAANRFSASNWPTAASIDLTKYFEFTITPNSGYRLNFTDFTYTGQVSSGTPTVVLRSSVDGFASNIGTPVVAGSTVLLSAAAYQGVTSAITFRYYAFGLAATTTTLSINDFTFNGTVDLIPSAPSLAISGTTSHGTLCPTVAGTPITYTITNSGPVAAAGVTVVSSDAQFVVSGLSSTTIAASGGTATYQVTFTPSSAGAKTSTVTVASTTSGSNSPTSSLTGTGSTPATAAVTSVAASSIGTTTASLNGNVTTLGVCPNTTEKGFVYSATATNATPVVLGTGVTKTAVAGLTTGAYSLAISGLTSSTGYSFRAYVYDGTTYTYGSVLTFSTTASLANDDCAGAINLTIGAAAVAGTFTGSTPMTGATKNDVFYMFTPLVTGTHVITINTFSVAADKDLHIYSSCPATYPGTTVASGTATSTTAETVSATFTAGVSYKILVQDFGSGGGTFNITVTGPAATLSVSSSTLSFGNQILLTNSSSQSFNLSGTFLTGSPSNIMVSAPNTNFQVSNDNATWGASTTIAYATQTLSSTPVYVRFVPQSTGAKTGNITFSGGGVTSPPTVAVSGTGILAAPVATAATNITTTSFDANWGAVTGATSYLLDVSTSSVFGTVGSATLTEGFNAGTTAPSGWTFTGALSTYTSAGNFGVSSPGLQFNASAQQVATPTLTGAATQLSFFLRGNGTSAGSATMLVEGFNGTSWVTVQSITTLPTTGVTVTYNASSTPALPANLVAFRFTYTKTTGNAAFDDVSINYATTVPSFVSGYDSLNVGNVTTYPVTGLTPGTTYYYRIRATDGTSTSANSNAITVIPASIGGTVTPNQTICSGTAPTTLTLSGNTGSVISWESATNTAFTSATTIANTTSTLTGAAIGNLTTTTYFRAVVQSGTNPTANSAYATINVTPIPTYGNLQFPASGTVCQGTNFTAYGQVFQGGITPGAGAGSGIGAEFGYSTTNADPSTWTNWFTATYNTDSGNNDEYQYTLTAPAGGTYYYTFRYRQGTCAYLYGGYSGSGGGFWNGTSNVSGVLTVNSLPTASIAGTTTVCQNATSPTITFTGANGTAPYTFTYTLNGGTNQTISTVSGNSVTLSAPTITAGAFTYALVSVAGQNCSQNQSGSAVVTVNGTSTAAVLSGNASICNGSSTNLSVAITGGTSPYTVVYTDGTTNFTVNSYVSGSNISVTPSSTTTYTLVSVTGANSCPGTGNSGSALVTISTSTTWTGGTSTVWTNAANWSCGVPLSNSNVTIGTGTFQPEIITSPTINTLTINASATLAVRSGYDLTVVDVINNNGTLVVENNANLVQVNNVSNTGSGSTIVRRNSSPVFRQDYTLWSSPVIGQQLQAFSPLTLSNRFYTFNAATNAYVATSASSNFVSGKGYLIRVKNDWVPYIDNTSVPASWPAVFTGSPFNGDLTVPISDLGPTPVDATPQQIEAKRGFNAIGNPYPSAIKLDSFIIANSDNIEGVAPAIEGTLWFWRKRNDTNNLTSYSTCTTLGCTVINGHTYADSDNISVGQGFIVKAKLGATGVNFTNTVRSDSNSDQFFRTSDSAVDRFWLEVKNSNNEPFGYNLLAYVPNATMDYDSGLDGLFLDDSPTAMYSQAGSQDVVIQGRPSFDVADVVPFVFKTDVADTYTISLQDTEGVFAADQNIFLRDNVTNTIQNLKTGSYSFTVAPGLINNRFDVIYQSPLAITDPALTMNDAIVYKQNLDIVVNTGKAIMSHVAVYDIRGRLLTSQTNVNASEARLNAGLTNQVLIVKITSVDNVTVTRKVIN